MKHCAGNLLAAKRTVLRVSTPPGRGPSGVASAWDASPQQSVKNHQVKPTGTANAIAPAHPPHLVLPPIVGGGVDWQKSTRMN